MCGGEKTEPAYLTALKRSLRNPTVRIRVLSSGSSPVDLVRLARAKVDTTADEYDQVWCVVDVDHFDMAAAASAAQAAEVELAVSNPCFELWLLLHHQQCSAPMVCCEDVTARLRKCLPGYDKTRLKFEQFTDGVKQAVGRARGLDPTGRDHRRNPSSRVWRLVAEMRRHLEIP